MYSTESYALCRVVCLWIWCSYKIQQRLVFINGTQDVFCEEVGELWSNTYHVCEFETSEGFEFLCYYRHLTNLNFMAI